MKFAKIYCFLLTIFVVIEDLGNTGAADAKPTQQIAAIVNDELITAYDLDSRLSLVVFSTRLPNTPAVRQRLRRQILRALVDEKLTLQEARRRNISVSRRDIRRAKAAIEKQNRLPKNRLDRILEEKNIPLETMEAQLRASVAWAKLLGRRLRPRITIGEDEIDETLSRIKARQGQVEYRLGEILLTIDHPREENSVRRRARSITDQVRKGASFSAIARQFSQNPTAAVGGDLGWVYEADLDKTLGNMVPNMLRGEITKPIRVVTGYRILILRDIRKITEVPATPATIDLRQIFLTLPKSPLSSDIDAKIRLAKTVRDSVKECKEFDLVAKQIGSSRSPKLGKFALRELSSVIRNIVKKIPVGGISEPVQMADGIMLLMVCNREGATKKIVLPDRDTIAKGILRRRLALLARRYMRDIRLAAVIDIRV
ncbi:MAG: peptidylprolyl isomerase [Pseudomonadota bacterium]|nr:peptidylprolyl isomerase [Pseudomonadota bacterium]